MLSPPLLLSKTLWQGGKKGTARELKVNNNQKKYPKLWKAATHTSLMTELTKKNNKKMMQMRLIKGIQDG